MATRYDKRDFVFRGTVDVASVRIWLTVQVFKNDMTISKDASLEVHLTTSARLR